MARQQVTRPAREQHGTGPEVTTHRYIAPVTARDGRVRSLESVRTLYSKGSGRCHDF